MLLKKRFSCRIRAGAGDIKRFTEVLANNIVPTSVSLGHKATSKYLTNKQQRRS